MRISDPVPRARRLVLAAVAAAAALLAGAAGAVGRVADVQVVDRESGTVLPIYASRGEYWVPGRPGARYAVLMRNQTGGRIMGVVSVDGVNVLTGDNAAFDQPGYVFLPGQQYEISGWRKTDAEVAAFYFSSMPDSYAARTGRPDNLGVIGVAVFRERPPPPIYAPYPQPRYPGDVWGNQRSAPAPQSEGGSAKSFPAPSSPSLGTGHGPREQSWVGRTEFERRSHRPDEVIRIRYDSLENLAAMGIVPYGGPAQPSAFPGVVTQPGYVPDPPPRWRY